VFLMVAAYYFWWPKWTGKRLNETIGKIHFWFLFVGFQVTFLIQHWLGVQGMPRRYGDYLPEDGFVLENHISTVGSVLLTISIIAFLYNVWWTWKKAPMVGVDDPWGYGSSLEWATSCPPPRHNFHSLPRIRSERPAFDLHYPEISGLSQEADSSSGQASVSGQAGSGLLVDAVDAADNDQGSGK
jgi:cytochrome c oxidase subunit 1